MDATSATRRVEYIDTYDTYVNVKNSLSGTLASRLTVPASSSLFLFKTGGCFGLMLSHFLFTC